MFIQDFYKHLADISIIVLTIRTRFGGIKAKKYKSANNICYPFEDSQITYEKFELKGNLVIK